VLQVYAQVRLSLNPELVQPRGSQSRAVWHSLGWHLAGEQVDEATYRPATHPYQQQLSRQPTRNPLLMKHGLGG
jgi:hypothetical protein